MKYIYHFCVVILMISTSFIIPSFVFAEDFNFLPYVPGQVIVKFRDSAVNLKSITPHQMTSFFQNQNKTVKDILPEENIVILEQNYGFRDSLFRGVNIHDDVVPQMIESYQNSAIVEYVQPNFLYKLNSNTFNDTLYPQQWYLENHGSAIGGMDSYYRSLGELVFPDGTEDREGKIAILISLLTKGKDNIDINYESAMEVYNMARERLSNEKREKR